MPRKAAISLIFVAVLAVCSADESTIEYARVQKAQSLSGVIRYQAGEPIPQVAVDDVRRLVSAVLQHTVTDAAGHCSLSSASRTEEFTASDSLKSQRFISSRFRVELTQRAKKPLDFHTACPVMFSCSGLRVDNPPWGSNRGNRNTLVTSQSSTTRPEPPFVPGSNDFPCRSN